MQKQKKHCAIMMRSLSLFLSLSATMAFTLAPPPLRQACLSIITTRLHDTIVSPFDNTDRSGSGDEPVATLPDMSNKGPLDLTWENVELVLDDMRPYLIQDGGNVAITEIDGPVVRLELQGACGTCPSSTVSLFMFSSCFLLLKGLLFGSFVTHNNQTTMNIDYSKH
jgi:NifU-like domain